MRLFLSMINAGIKSDMKLSKKSRLRIINGSMFLAAMNIVLYNCSYFYFAEALAPSMIVIPSICIVGIIFSWWLNLRKQVNWGIHLFLLFSMLSVFYISRYYLGSDFGYQYYFLVFGMLPFVYFETKDRIVSVIYSVINFRIFLFLDAGQFSYIIEKSHYYYNHEIASFFKMSNRIIAFITLATVMWIFDWVINKDEDDLVKALEVANYNATYDYLTKILNRRAITEMLYERFEDPQQLLIPISLVMLDIDDFKKINDNYGHLRGDEVLEKLSRIIESNLPETCRVARWGGEEFLLYLEDTKNSEGYEIAERIRLKVSDHSIVSDINITISLGLATRIDDESFSSLINRADQMMYEAKKTGKNSVGKNDQLGTI